jgi:hypothetical protein
MMANKEETLTREELMHMTVAELFMLRLEANER